MSGLAGILELAEGLAGGLSIAFDGRIDNRDELLAAFTDSAATETDGALVLRAYERWGEDSPAHLLGDFAYVIWDPRVRRLFCARDPLGIRPFYYFTDGRVFLWASEPHQLLSHPAVPKRPNESMVAEYLAVDLCSLEQTLYQGIYRLPPAHFISVGPAGLRKQRYWDAGLSRRIRYRNNSEYAEHFHEVLKESVRCRLRSEGPVGAELSGGVDSSCVVGMCQSLFRSGAAPGQGFETFSLVFPGRRCDETEYLREVVRFWKLESSEVPVTPDPEWYADCARRYQYLPDHANFHMSDLLSTLAGRKGIRVLLTGLGGDDWFTGLPPWQGSSMRRALHRLREEPSVATLRSLSAGLLRRVRRHPDAGTSQRACPWIPAAFYSRAHASLDKPDTLSPRVFASRTQEYLYRSFSDAFRLHCFEMTRRASVRCGMEHRHPLHDRRLIELSLAFPADQLWSGNQGKAVLRRAMKGLVPDRVLNRSTKAEFSHTSAQLFESDCIAPLFRSPRIAEQGWVDRDQVALMYQEFVSAYRAGNESPPRVWPLSMILAVELWFRAAFA